MKTSNPFQTVNPHAGTSADSRWILVVDDDVGLLGVIEMVLSAEGWTVKVADGAESAIATIDAAASPPTVLICDVLMKGVDGMELTRRLVKRLPELKAILISAHLAEESWWPWDLRARPFLQKPFSNEQLITAVREALAG